MLCHGNPTEHCCFVGGVRCPNLLQGPEIAAAVEALVALHNLKGRANNIAKRLDDGITSACHVALKVLAAHLAATGQLADRATFEAGWVAHPDYQPIADAWALIGKPRSWCAEYGPAEVQCCFAEDPTTNDARAADIPVTVRNLRNAIGSV